MANQKCAICGAEINLIQQQKLADGNYICRKTCRKKGFKNFDFVHGTLPQVTAHLAQVERGTRLWETYFIPRRKTKDKAKKLHRFGSALYVAEDVGLMAFVETRYKIFIFGKTELACVYRIADLVGYAYETGTKETSDGKSQNTFFAHLTFRGVEGLADFNVPISGNKEFEKLEKYFNTLFGIQKTLGNIANTWKSQINAAKALGSALNTAMKEGEGEALEGQAQEAAAALDTAIYGDRTEWIRRADEALAAVQ